MCSGPKTIYTGWAGSLCIGYLINKFEVMKGKPKKSWEGDCKAGKIYRGKFVITVKFDLEQAGFMLICRYIPVSLWTKCDVFVIASCSVHVIASKL